MVQVHSPLVYPVEETRDRKYCAIIIGDLNISHKFVERSIMLLARIMKIFCMSLLTLFNTLLTIADYNHFLNYYGEECARLNFDQRVHGWKYRPSLSMKIFAPLLFMVPRNNVRMLHGIFVDDIVNKEKWNMFVSKLDSQLQETSVLVRQRNLKF